MDNIKEIEPEDAVLLDYMLIPVKEYRDLITEVAKQKQQIFEYYNQAELYKGLVAEYKHDMHQLLGIKELKRVKEEKGIGV